MSAVSSVQTRSPGAQPVGAFSLASPQRQQTGSYADVSVAIVMAGATAKIAEGGGRTPPRHRVLIRFSHIECKADLYRVPPVVFVACRSTRSQTRGVFSYQRASAIGAVIRAWCAALA